MSLKVAIVGARRRRQGTGEYVARDFAAAGCDVCAIVGTRPATIRAAREQLASAYGIQARGYDALGPLIEEENPDVVAICSPMRHHAAHLEVAGRAGAHVFCEKPLWWTEPPPGEARAVARETARLCAPFLERQRLLELNTQWPHTLEEYWAIHPEERGEPIRSLEMRLSPTSRGPEMVLDSASHLISLLFALVGPGQMKELDVRGAGEKSVELELSFRYLHNEGETDVRFWLKRQLDPPRPAGYAINGRRVERQVVMPEYKIHFAANGRTVPVPDPLTLRIADFLDGVREGRQTDTSRLEKEMKLLWELVTVVRRTNQER